MQGPSRRHRAVVAATAVTLLVASACSHQAPQRTWLESEGTIYPHCDEGPPAKARTVVAADTSIPPGDVRVSMVDAITGKPVPAVQLVHNYAQITPDSLAFTNIDGTVRVHYLQRSAVVLAVNTVGWLPDSVTVDTRAGSAVQFALRSLCTR